MISWVTNTHANKYPNEKYTQMNYMIKITAAGSGGVALQEKVQPPAKCTF